MSWKPNCKNDKQGIENEFGDVLFAMINYARFLDINPEDALERTNQKFIQRFQYIENQIAAQNKHITDADTELMNFYWEESKSISNKITDK